VRRHGNVSSCWRRWTAATGTRRRPLQRVAAGRWGLTGVRAQQERAVRRQRARLLGRRQHSFIARPRWCSVSAAHGRASAWQPRRWHNSLRLLHQWHWRLLRRHDDGDQMRNVARGMAGGGVRHTGPKRAATRRSAGGTTVLEVSPGGGELGDGWFHSGRCSGGFGQRCSDRCGWDALLWPRA
jgi:hypothetical protein